MSAVPPGVSVEVDVGHLQLELRKLWGTDAAAAVGNVVRACALNLLVVTWESPDAEAIRDAMLKVTETHPARTILVRAGARLNDDGRPQEGELRSWIAYRCQPPLAGGARVCHEDICIEISGESLQYLDTVVFSILEPDMPRFLWWCGSLPDTADSQRVFGHLAEQCDRLMIDTRQMMEPGIDLVALSHLTVHEERRAALGDLNWHRMAGWRQMLSQCFDPPDRRPWLRRIRGGRLRWEAVGPEIPVQVLLYLGWLGSGLGWSLAGKDPRGCVFEQGDRTIRFELEPGRGPDTRLTEVQVDVDMAGFEIRRRGNSLERVIRTEGCADQVAALPAPPLDLAAVLESEMAILTRNPVYERALQMAERLARVL